MSVIAIQTEPRRVKGCSSTAAAPRQARWKRRIELAIEHSIAAAKPEDDAPDSSR
jgi:hypothetical protein